MLDTKDWFTDQLAAHPNTLVADRDWLQKLYGITSGAQFSLRLVSDISADYHLPVLIVRHDNLHILDTIGCHQQIHDLRTNVFGNLAPRIPVIVVPATPCLLADARYGVYCGEHGTRSLTAWQLATFFAWFNLKLTENPGATKEIFHETRDAYQLFTRAFFGRNLVVQDFDMLRLVGEKWQAVELKRVQEAPATWEPYCNDSRNFCALAQASAAFGMLEPLCIGYRKYQRAGAPDLVAVHSIQTATYNRIAGMRCISDVGHLFNVQPVDSYISTRRVARKVA